MHGTAGFALAAIEALDQGVAVCDPSLNAVLFANRQFHEIVQPFRPVGTKLVEAVADAARTYVSARRCTGRLPNTIRLARPDETGLYVRVLPGPVGEHLEIVLLREETRRDPELFRELNARYQVTRREYQALAGIRLGKTNKVLAAELSVSVNTVNKLVCSLLQRFEVANRTQLADLVERIASRRA